MAHHGINTRGIQCVRHLAICIPARSAYRSMPHRINTDKHTCQTNCQAQIFVQMPMGKHGNKQYSAHPNREAAAGKAGIALSRYVPTVFLPSGCGCEQSRYLFLPAPAPPCRKSFPKAAASKLPRHEEIRCFRQGRTRNSLRHPARSTGMKYARCLWKRPVQTDNLRSVPDGNGDTLPSAVAAHPAPFAPDCGNR